LSKRPDLLGKSEKGLKQPNPRVYLAEIQRATTIFVRSQSQTDYKAPTRKKEIGKEERNFPSNFGGKVVIFASSNLKK